MGTDLLRPFRFRDLGRVTRRDAARGGNSGAKRLRFWDPEICWQLNVWIPKWCFFCEEKRTSASNLRVSDWNRFNQVNLMWVCQKIMDLDGFSTSSGDFNGEDGKYHQIQPQPAFRQIRHPFLWSRSLRQIKRATAKHMSTYTYIICINLPDQKSIL